MSGEPPLAKEQRPNSGRCGPEIDPLLAAPSQKAAVDVNSVGGLVQEKLGRLPRQGEKVRFPDFGIEVLGMVGPRIQLVRVRPLEPAIPDDG